MVASTLFYKPLRSAAIKYNKLISTYVPESTYILPVNSASVDTIYMYISGCYHVGLIKTTYSSQH